MKKIIWIISITILVLLGTVFLILNETKQKILDSRDYIVVKVSGAKSGYPFEYPFVRGISIDEVLKELNIVYDKDVVSIYEGKRLVEQKIDTKLFDDTTIKI